MLTQRNKRIFSGALAFLLLLFSLAACQNEGIGADSPSDPAETTEEPYEATTDASENSAGKWYDDQFIVSVDDSGETHTNIHSSLLYCSFEGYLSEVTDIVLATFNGRTTQGITYIYEFSVLESIRGLGIEESIAVSSLPSNCTVLDKEIEFSTYECNYQINERYLLLLKRSRTAYDEVDSFSFAEDSLIIHLNSSGRVMSDSSLYGEPLKNHVQNDAIRSAMQNGTFSEELLSLVEENPLYHGESYEGTSDMSSVLLHSDFVFEITVDWVFMETFDKTAITYSCTIDRTHKGETAYTEILVKFPHNNDIVGERFIVAVNAIDQGNGFIMSSPYSIFDVSERDTIIALINTEK